jgi:CHAT domain-containing protein
MRWRFLLSVLVGAACSCGPSATKAYTTAWTEFRQGKLQQAQQTVDAALKNHKRDRPAEALTPLRLLQAEIRSARGQVRTASGLLGQVTDPQEPALHLRWLVDRAEVLFKLDPLNTTNTDQAYALLDTVDRIAGNKGLGDWAFKSLLLRGYMLVNAHRFDEGEDVLRDLLHRASESGDSYNQASALLNLSLSKLRRNHYDESIAYSRSALELAEKIHAGRIAAIANDNLGVAYNVLHDLDRAEEYQNKAIAQLREMDDLKNLADALGGLGNMQLLRHKPTLAAHAFEEAVAIAKRAEATGDAVRWAGRLAFALIEQQDWNAAESWNRQAYALHGARKDSENDPYLEFNTAAIENGRGNIQEAERLYRKLISETEGVPYIEWDAYMRLGALLAKEHKYTEANTEYECGLAAIERVRSSLIKDDYRLSYHDLQMEFFKDYVDLLVLENHPEQALEVAEYSRARVLAERLGMPPVAMKDVHAADFKLYARRTHSALLSFWLAPQESFVWVIKPDSIQMRRLGSGDKIGELIHNYQKIIVDDRRDPLDAGLPQAQRLSSALLEPIRGDLGKEQKVVIVPDGELHTLNLETLPAPGANHYWIEDVEVSIAPSLTVLAKTPPRPPSVSKPSLLLIGAPVSADPEYRELPGAKAEIERVQSRFAGTKLVLPGAAASPRGFFNAMPARYSMIHFAAHAETNSQSPLESAVILSKDGDSYKLYARDVAQLNPKLSADLVTISACRSAGARAYGGEGLVGIAWAFLESGAWSVVAGLWDVGDSSSSELMDKLYESLAKGALPAAALRSAKLSLLRSHTSQSKPVSWAPYQIYIR